MKAKKHTKPLAGKWHILLFLAAAVIAWRIVVIGMADHYVDQVRNGDKQAVDKALFWDNDHPVALFFKAEMIYEEEPDRAVAMLQRAIRANPADSKPLLLLARIRLAMGDAVVADSMVDTALKILPSDPRVLQNAAQYWYTRDNLPKSVATLSRALEADPSLANELIPIFLEVAENPAGHDALKRVAENPPAWWERFFVEAARRAKETDTVRILYNMRRAVPDTPLSDKERNAYIERLRKDGAVMEAYLVWVNGLDKRQREELGYLYDGSFELEFDDAGFGWHAADLKRHGITLNTAQTYGIDGQAALHVAFTGKTFRFRHLYQPLRLSPGEHVFTGKVRTDKLQTRGGMQWQLRCTVGSNELLATSDRYLGSGEWIDFQVKFTVPEGCIGQEIRLVSTGNRDVDHEMSGEIWFDRLSIRRL